MALLRLLVFVLGLALVGYTLLSAVKTFVVPRPHSDWITASVFVTLRRVFDLCIYRMHSYESRDRLMALYAPIGLLLLVPVWLTLVMLGYMAMYWATGITSLNQDFAISGSSLLTLGFAKGETLFDTLLSFSEAIIGLILVALLIAYLPTMYSAFSKREVAVNQLSVRAGTPPSAAELIARAHRIGALPSLRDLWVQWESWFAELEESHTSLAALVFFRSPDPHHSWITAAGAVLDSAALLLSVVDVPNQPQAALCIRAGYLALRRVAHYFVIPYNPDPHFPKEPISVTRQEFEAICDQLASGGVPLKPNRERAWQEFGGWRVNDDQALLALCSLTMAPPAPWSSDRAKQRRRPSIRRLARRDM
jgi:hypothetical protein